MAKKKQSKGAPRWMTTFADLSTLLLTFFIIMLSMANIDAQKFREMLGSVRDAFGVQFQEKGEFEAVSSKAESSEDKQGKSKVDEDRLKELYQSRAKTKTDKEEAKSRADQQKENDRAVAELKAAASQAKLDDQTEIVSGANGIRIRVKGKLLFTPGNSTLKDEAKPFLDNLIMVLERFDYFLLVEGHTDSIPISTAQFPSNWELSGSRASAVLRYLIDLGVEPVRLTSVGLADNYPLTENDTAEGRSANRRVEFVLTKHSFRPEIQ